MIVNSDDDEDDDDYTASRAWQNLCFDKEIKLFFLLFLLLLFFRLLICLLFMLSILAIVQRQSSRHQFVMRITCSLCTTIYMSPKMLCTTTMTILSQLQLIHKYSRLLTLTESEEFMNICFSTCDTNTYKG